MKNNLYICSPKTKGTGCSSVRLEYSSGGRVVAGSNPVTPTDSNAKVSALRQRLFCCPHVFCSRTFFHMYIAARLSVLAHAGFLDACFSLGTGSGACARGEFAVVPGGAVRPGAMRVGRLASECRRPERVRGTAIQGAMLCCRSGCMNRCGAEGCNRISGRVCGG